MKKKLFSIVGAGLTMVAVLTFVYVKNDVNKNNEIFNANVEALADEEDKDYNNAKNVYCTKPAGALGCKATLFRKCTEGVFCID